VGTVGPSAEVCDGADNDCDGQTDEGFNIGAACDGVGACGAGTRECAGPNQTRCSTDPGGSRSQVAAEVCDGADNDCDGQVNEGLANCCDGGGAVPCNGCPAGTVVPDGWACIPAGSFQMGSPADEPGRGGDETQHQQDISRPYLMKVTEVTQGEWFLRMGTRPSLFAACGDTCPVEQVNWYEAVAYVNALSSAERLERCYADAQGNDYDAADAGAERTPVWRNGTACRGYRLPTEAEWEKAARAGTATASYNGPVGNLECELDANLDAIAWYCGNANNTTHPVRGKRANDWGLYDMLGNVWEWCWDRYNAYPGVPAADYGGPAAGDYRVSRGGSWYNNARDVRAANRNGFLPEFRNGSVGFRPARSVIP